jgi:hypothetical protein
MGDSQLAREYAKRHIRIADHMLTQTFPLVKDTKILIAVTENIFEAAKHTMEAIIYYEQ